MSNKKLQEFLDRDENKDMLRFLTAGSVDDGKSTLIGRLLYDSKTIYQDQLETLERDSKRIGHAGDSIDYALVVDGLRAEREQGITIDVAYRYFSTNKRKFIIADTPGHEQYTRNMITGGSTAELAIVLIDAGAGVVTQTKRHTFLISLLGIKNIVVAINKMDLVDYSETVYNNIVSQYAEFVDQLEFRPVVTPIPLSALKGDNIVSQSANMDWYKGQTLLDILETINVDNGAVDKPFRLPVQYVIRPDLNFRGFAGKIVSGTIDVGDRVEVLPSHKESTVKSIYVCSKESQTAQATESVTITLSDEIDVSRGDMIVKKGQMSPVQVKAISSTVVWVDEVPMNVNKEYIIKHTTQTARANISSVNYKININNFEKHNCTHLELNDIGRVELTLSSGIVCDPYLSNRSTGAYIIIDPITNNTCGVGMIDLSNICDAGEQHISDYQTLITDNERHQAYGSAKTLFINRTSEYDVAYMIERQLYDKGCNVVVIDDVTLSDKQVINICQILSKNGIISIGITHNAGEIISRDHIDDVVINLN